MIGGTVDIEGRVRRNPYGMVAGALGLGFVLGGGLFTRLTAGIVGAGLRIGLMSVLPLFKDEMVRVARRAIDGAGMGMEINKGESQ